MTYGLKIAIICSRLNLNVSKAAKHIGITQNCAHLLISGDCREPRGRNKEIIDKWFERVS